LPAGKIDSKGKCAEWTVHYAVKAALDSFMESMKEKGKE